MAIPDDGTNDEHVLKYYSNLSDPSSRPVMNHPPIPHSAEEALMTKMLTGPKTTKLGSNDVLFEDDLSDGESESEMEKEGSNWYN